MSRLYLGLTFILLFLTFNQKVKAEELYPELQEVLLRLGSKTVPIAIPAIAKLI